MRWICCCFIGASLIFVSTAIAQDLVRDSIPGRWIEPMLPEELPPLEVPSYYTDLEKAKAMAFRGRYKGALIQLRSVKDADAKQLALIKAACLAARGHEEDALKELATDGEAGIERARILLKLGRTDEC